jgi:ribonuclease P protein 1
MKLKEAIGGLDDLPITVTSQHYLSCYPSSQLVYLSPDAPTTLTRFNHDDVYVIGAMIDGSSKEDPLTLAKAKKDEIRTAKFPLDQHVQ